MSDTGGHTSSSSPPHRHPRSTSPHQLNSVPEDDRLSASVTQRNSRNRNGQSRNRHRATPAKVYAIIYYIFHFFTVYNNQVAKLFTKKK